MYHPASMITGTLAIEIMNMLRLADMDDYWSSIAINFENVGEITIPKYLASEGTGLHGMPLWTLDTDFIWEHFRETLEHLWWGHEGLLNEADEIIADAPTVLGVTVEQVLSAIEGNVSGPIHTLELGDGRYVTKKVFSGIPRRRMFAYHSSEGISTILFAINENAQPVPLQATQLNYNDVLSLLPDDVTRFATIGSSTFDGRLIYFISVEHDADFDFASLEVSLDE